MAREVITKVWCDLCLGEEHHQEADHTTHVALTAPGRVIKPLSLDLCELHHKQLLGPVQDALDEYGAPVDGTPKTRTPNTASLLVVGNCRVPGCSSNGGRGFKSHASFSAHVRQMHGMTIGAYRDQYGQEPTNPDAAPGDEETLQFNVGEEFKCPDCDAVYSTALGNNRPAQALGLHRSKRHGYKAAS